MSRENVKRRTQTHGVLSAGSPRVQRVDREAVSDEKILQWLEEDRDWEDRDWEADGMTNEESSA